MRKSHGEGVTSGQSLSPIGRRIPPLRSLPLRQPPITMLAHVAVDVDVAASAGTGAAASRVNVDLDDDVGVGRADVMPPRNILETACLPPESEETSARGPASSASPRDPPGRTCNAGETIPPTSTDHSLQRDAAASCTGSLRRRALTAVVLLSVTLLLCIVLVIVGFVLASSRRV